MVDKIKMLTNKQLLKLIDLRNQFHKYPELSNQEFLTQTAIIDYLNRLEVFKVQKIASTGVIATIKGRKHESNKSLALRADIDALPINEENNVPYRSQNQGVMHACGHDVHLSILLGVASNLVSLIDEFSGTVKLFFQPAEETTGGALRMIREGCLDNPHVEAVFGLHVEPSLPVGSVYYKAGPMYAYADMLKIIVTGVGCHAAHPEEGVDAIVASAAIINNLQTIVSRKVASTGPAVLTIGIIKGGTVANQVAKQVVLEGTFRTLDPNIRTLMMNEIKSVVTNTALAFGASAEVLITEGYPVLNNNSEMVEFFVKHASRVLGPSNVLERPRPTMGAEDFAYFANQRPSCFYSLGVGNQEIGIIHPLHSPYFNIDEKSLYYGTVLQTILAIEFLNEKGEIKNEKM